VANGSYLELYLLLPEYRGEQNAGNSENILVVVLMVMVVVVVVKVLVRLSLPLVMVLVVFGLRKKKSRGV